MKLISLFDGLSLRTRLSLLSAVALLLMAVPMAGWLSGIWEDWRFQSAERAGLPATLALLEASQAVSRHRDVSMSFLNGEDGADAAIRKAADGAAAAVTRAREAAAAYSQGVGEALQRAETAFGTLSAAVAKEDLAARDAFERHGPVLRDLSQSQARVLSESGLLLDPYPRSYFLIIAGFQEGAGIASLLGEMRTIGGQAMANKGLSGTDGKLIAAVQAQLENRLRFVRETLAESAAHDAHPELLASQKAADAAIEKALAINRQAFLGLDNDWTVGAVAYREALDKAVAAQAALTATIARTIEAELQQTATTMTRELAAAAGVLSILMIVGGLVLLRARHHIAASAELALLHVQQLGAGQFEQAAKAPDIAPGTHNELDRVLLGIHSLALRWSDSMGVVHRAATSVDGASAEMAAGNQHLGARTEMAAARLQETASSLQGLTEQVRQTTQAADDAHARARQAGQLAVDGGTTVTAVVEAMRDIQHRSRRIAEIVGVIDGIAFQTNILALNAAVEAARAGEQGRGFAVVAAEVRHLAQRSAESAREIRSLIQTSVEKVDAGNELAARAGHFMQDIVASVQSVVATMGHISHAATTQRHTIETVHGSVRTLDDMTQQNAALVEQGGAAAESLREQSRQLVEAMARLHVT